MITPHELACIAPVAIANAVVDELKAGDVALSPGMKYRHYAPKAPLVLLDGDINDIVSYVKAESLSKVAVLCYSDDEESISSLIPSADRFVIGAKDNIKEQAQHLFSILRDADKNNYDKIYAPIPSKDGVGLALYNRMIRAAAHTIIDLRRGENG
jgi:L-threonylcarbamoyladenylate synthase